MSKAGIWLHIMLSNSNWFQLKGFWSPSWLLSLTTSVHNSSRWPSKLLMNLNKSLQWQHSLARSSTSLQPITWNTPSLPFFAPKLYPPRFCQLLFFHWKSLRTVSSYAFFLLYTWVYTTHTHPFPMLCLFHVDVSQPIGILCTHRYNFIHLLFALPYFETSYWMKLHLIG